MAPLPNTKLTTTAVGNRESLSNVVDRTEREETPVYSLISKGSAESVRPEWLTESMAAPGANRQAEGDEYDFAAVEPPKRMGNYTQIMRKSFIISKTQETVSEAGNTQKTKHQKLLKGLELKGDVEYALLAPNPSIGGANRQLGGLPSWYETNVSRGAGGANGGFDFNTGLTIAPTDGTKRAFTKTIMDDVMQQGWESGAKFKTVSVSPYVKSVFVQFMSDANVVPFRQAVKDGEGNTIISNADFYHGPFGLVAILPNRVQTAYADLSDPSALARNAHFIDPSKLSFEWLRRIAEDKNLAKTGDANKTVLIGEGTLEVKNEKGLGVAADLFGVNATT